VPSELRYRWRLQMQVLTTRSQYDSAVRRAAADAHGDRVVTFAIGCRGRPHLPLTGVEPLVEAPLVRFGLSWPGACPGRP
jgi:hypothetical protein